MFEIDSLGRHRTVVDSTGYRGRNHRTGITHEYLPNPKRGPYLP